MVRLKENTAGQRRCRKGHFNSTMVRLKEDGKFMMYDCFKFQFHYGSIKGPDRLYRRVRDNQFQFHYGSIKGFCRASSY